VTVTDPVLPEAQGDTDATVLQHDCGRVGMTIGSGGMQPLCYVVWERSKPPRALSYELRRESRFNVIS
jgi:hypothetical protein